MGIPDEQEAVVAPQRPTHPTHEQVAHRTTRGIVAYLLIAFGLAWAIWIPLWLLHVSAGSQLFQWLFLAGTFAPALATIVVRRWITHEGFADAGLRLHLRSAWPYYLFAGLWPFLVFTGSLALAVVLGFSMRMVVFVDIVPSVISTLVMIPVFWGEEFGWRGYLQIRLFSNRPRLSAVTTGAIWGVWHYPAALAGVIPYEHGLVSLVLIPWYMIMFSIILGWLRLRTGSVWVVSLAHSANNNIIPALGPILFISGGYGDLLLSPRGILVVIPMLILCAWIVLSGQLAPQTSTPIAQEAG
jgi:membrane protease YdiL (CAAX protease family)